MKFKTYNDLRSGNNTDFWQKISKIAKRKDGVSSVIDGQIGDGACKAFSEAYSKLYNSNPSDNIEETIGNVNNIVNNQCQGLGKCNDQNHLHKVTPEMVKRAIGRLKRNQFDYTCNIMSDNFIYGPENLYIILSFLYTMMLSHNFIHENLNVTTLIPIPKDKKKSLANSSNYRAIGPSGVLLKVLDYIILEYFENIFSTEDQQFAYKESYSPTMCSFLVTETIQYYTNSNSSIYAISLDFSKAFDYVKYDELFKCLISRGMCGVILRFILNIYLNAKYRVKWNGCQGNSFGIQNGVKQGGVFSAYLFAIFIDSLIVKVKASKLGCYVGDKCAAIFVFADDVLILCPSRRSAQRLLDICFDFTQNSGMKFNMDKCKYMIFGNYILNDVNLSIGGNNLKFVTQESHVGHDLSSNGDIINFTELISNLGQKTNCIKRKFVCLDTECRTTLFKSQCNPMFGIELIDILSNQFKTLKVKWRKCVRYLCDVHPRTHNELVPTIMGSPSIEGQVYSRILCFVKKGLQHKNDYISFFYKNCMINMHSFMSTNVNIILQYVNLTQEELRLYSEAFIKKKFKSMVNHDWKSNMVNELLRCRDGVMECGLSSQEINELLTVLCID